MAFTIAVKWASSHTKMYTGAATMILKERELLSLDDPISKFLPDTILEGLHRHKGSDYSDQLRIYHLISQTSGLPDYFLTRPKGGKSMYDLIVSGSDEEWDMERAVDIAKSGLSPKFPLSATPELIGHSGASSAFLFNLDGTRLYMAGTLNQLEKQGRPFRLLLKIERIVGEVMSG